MNNSNNSINKNLYKIFLTLVKYVPMFLSIIQTLRIVCNYIGVDMLILSYLGGTSIPFLIVLFIMSFVFKFCYLYRIPLMYLLVIWLIAILDSIFTIPLSVINMFIIYTIVFGIFIISFVWFMYKNRNKPKIDHIKQFCENYHKCCK